MSNLKHIPHKVLKNERIAKLKRLLSEDLPTSSTSKLPSFKSPKLALIVQQNNVELPKVNILRGKVISTGGKMTYIKSSLTKIAIKNTKFSSLEPLLCGMNNLILSDSPISTLKVVYEHCKLYPNEFQLMGGCFDGTPLNQELLNTLNNMEPDDHLRMENNMKQLASIMQGPMMSLYSSLNANSKKWLVLLQLKQKLEAEEKASKVIADTPAPL